jgi:hypothetical protein
MFSVLLMASIFNAINRLGNEVETGSEQIFDTGINKPFKGYPSEELERWMVMNGLRHLPHRGEAFQWSKSRGKK